MKSGAKVLLGLLVVVVLIAVFCVGSYNGVISAQEAVEQYKGDIDSNLQRRADLVPNLVETVKAYAAHEEEVFTALANARAAMMGAGTVAEQAQADAAMNTALSRLMAISESYPELKSNENFRDLQTQLEGTENRINVARVKYNEAVQGYNSKIRSFPGVFFAGLIGAEKAEYFEAEAGAQEAPKVDFN